MKLIALSLLSLAAACAADTAGIAARLKQIPASHPRLFLKPGAEEQLSRTLAADPARRGLRAALLARADDVLTETPVQRTLIGRRLLGQSRAALHRILHLGLAWRLTASPKYAERARAEMLSAAAFTDWNPSHFLDVAEMTTAMGIGYDWFYGFLDDSARAAIRTAITEKGLKRGLVENSWTRAAHNWNQVCNAGMAVGALAIAESDPDLAARLIAQAIDTVPLAMQQYAPDGAYPEGASYWDYGTTFNVILISALESVLGSDFGLSKQPGFLATADFRLHIFGPTGSPFNYSDSGRGRSGPSPAMFWFAAARRTPSLLWTEWAKLEALENEGREFRNDRAAPLLALWLAPGQARPTEPPPLYWAGNGPTPVAFHRTGWDANAVFVAIKGGSPATNHAHMDTGAFVMDADGTRWADDLGMQDYNSLESKGVDLWSRGQDAARWKVFRLSTAAHSVLMVDNAQQRYDSNAPIARTNSRATVIDLSATYRGQLETARRGIQLRPDRTVLIQDEFVALAAKPAHVRWAMVTMADVAVAGPGRAVLTRDGKKLNFSVLEPAGATLRIYPTDPPPAETDAPNPGTRILGFEVSAPAGATSRLRVLLIPQSARSSATPARSALEVVRPGK